MRRGNCELWQAAEQLTERRRARRGDEALDASQTARRVNERQEHACINERRGSLKGP